MNDLIDSNDVWKGAHKLAAERGIAIVDRARRAIYVEKKTRGNKQRLTGQSLEVEPGWKRSVQRQSKTDP